MERIPESYLVTDENGVDQYVCNINALTEMELANEGFTDFGDLQLGQEFQFINSMLKWSKSSGLEVEVIQFALKYMKEDPRLTPAMAMRYGFNEWVK